MRKCKFRWVAAIVALGLLPGCSALKAQWADRYGPDPVLHQVATAETAIRENDVVTALLRANGYARDNVANDLPTSNAAWYGVIMTGFNVVDDACQTYINDLWKIDREKNRVKDVISASGAATAAIVGANANPSAKTLTTLAQAFGLASALTGAIGDSYLFAQDPASLGQIVKKLQVAYRNELAKNIGPQSYPINSYAAVYYHTREYLSLCLPPTIQAQVQDLVAKAKASPDNTPPPAARTLSSGKPAKAATMITLSPGN
jgi:hypothetical protein